MHIILKSLYSENNARCSEKSAPGTGKSSKIDVVKKCGHFYTLIMLVLGTMAMHRLLVLHALRY